MADNLTEVQSLYVAYFSRPGDPAGVNYWVNAMNSNPAAYQAISASFSHSAEYQAMYGGKSNADMVNTVYLNLFGRAAEKAGVDFWVNEINSGRMSIDNVVTQISKGAQNQDLFAFNAKVAVSTAFTDRVDLPNEQKAYSGEAANKLAIEFIATVKDINSAAAARDPGAIDDVIAKIVAANGSGFDDAHIIGVAPSIEPPIYG